MIREMTTTDVTQVMDLIREMHGDGVLSKWSLNPERADYILHKLLSYRLKGENVFLEVLELDEKVVGFFAGEAVTNEWVDCTMAVDLGFYITPEYRKGTYGVRMIKNFEKWSEAVAKCDLMRVAVFAGVANDRTAKLLDRIGFSRAGTLHNKELQSCA